MLKYEVRSVDAYILKSFASDADVPWFWILILNYKVPQVVTQKKITTTGV